MPLVLEIGLADQGIVQDAHFIELDDVFPVKHFIEAHAGESRSGINAKANARHEDQK
jgi:hypothetical protein